MAEAFTIWKKKVSIIVSNNQLRTIHDLIWPLFCYVVKRTVYIVAIIIVLVCYN